MIVQRTFYNIMCDCCNEPMTIDWEDDKVRIMDLVEDCDYLRTADGHYYCPGCYHVDDNFNYDTEDGHVYDGKTKEEIK